MTKTEALQTLQHYQKWRRDNDNNYAMPEPAQIGKALDIAIKTLKQEVSK